MLWIIMTQNIMIEQEIRHHDDGGFFDQTGGNPVQGLSLPNLPRGGALVVGFLLGVGYASEATSRL